MAAEHSSALLACNCSLVMCLRGLCTKQTGYIAPVVLGADHLRSPPQALLGCQGTTNAWDTGRAAGI